MRESRDAPNEEVNSSFIDRNFEDALSQIRARIVDSALFFLIIISFPSVFASITRGLELGWKPIHYIHFSLYLCLFVPLLLRNYLPFAIRTGVLLIACFVVGLSGIFTFGLMGGILLLVFACVIATALYGRKWGYLFVLICTVPIGILGFAVVNGAYTFSFDFEQYAYAPTSWILRVLGFAGLSAAMVHGSGMLYHHLLRSVSELTVRSQDLVETNIRLRDEISEREQTQVELRSSEERYRLLSENVTDVVSIQNLDMSIIYVSPSIYEQRGFTPDELIELPIEKLLTPDSTDLLAGELEEILAQFELGEFDSSGSWTTEYEGYRKDGSTISLERVASILVDEAGKPTQIMGVTRDISARKLAEAEKQLLETKMLQMQKMESLGLLAGGIAHDFNNLLTSVMGNADLARSAINRPAEAEEYLDRVLKITERAADLCLQLLAYSGKGKFVLETVDIGEQVLDSEQLLRVSVAKTIHIECNIAQGVHCVEADASQMQQVIMNLVINAGEAIGKEAGRITLSVDSLECDAAYLNSLAPDHHLKAGIYVKIEVTDTGQGMGEATLERIFDPFFTSKETGHGLGLAAVTGIVTAHQGVVKVYSELGIGTTFKILLPASENIKKTEVSQTPRDPEVGDRGTVLIVDDNAAVRQTAGAMLTSNGFEVLFAQDGNEAVNIYLTRGDEIQLVLLDLTMPGISGEETFRQLRSIHTEVRVVFSSGFDQHETTSRFVGKGLASFIQKPYKIVDLIRTMEAALRQAE